MIRLSPISRPSDLPVLKPLAELKPELASPPGGPAELPLAKGRERSAGSRGPGRCVPRLSASRTAGPARAPASSGPSEPSRRTAGASLSPDPASPAVRVPRRSFARRPRAPGTAVGGALAMLFALAALTLAVPSTAQAQNATGAPGITGTARVGGMLTATKGTIADSNGLHTTWFSNATTTVQWIRVDGGSDSDISSATDRTYTLVTADEGKQVKVRVDFADADANAESRTSDAYPAGSTVLPVDMSGTTRVVSFSGDPTVGTALTATLSNSDNGVSGTPTWQWARSARPDTGFTDISSATGASYTPVEMDRAFFLRATATYSDGGGSGKTAPGTTALPVGIASGVFIKNTRQTARPFHNNSPRTLYQGFRTGDNPAGYLLTLVPGRVRSEFRGPDRGADVQAWSWRIGFRLAGVRAAAADGYPKCWRPHRRCAAGRRAGAGN